MLKLTESFARIFSVLAIFAVILPINAGELRPFDVNSFGQIEQRYAGRHYMVSVWSLECPPCLKELKMFGRLREAYPRFELVLINTDGADYRSQAKQMLESFQLGDVEAWMFSADQPERLRYSIDPEWYGELPRSYLYQPGQRKAHSGLLDETLLQEWLGSQ